MHVNDAEGSAAGFDQCAYINAAFAAQQEVRRFQSETVLLQ
jgi:hypothetical protein